MSPRSRWRASARTAPTPRSEERLGSGSTPRCPRPAESPARARAPHRLLCAFELTLECSRPRTEPPADLVWLRPNACRSAPHRSRPSRAAGLGRRLDDRSGVKRARVMDDKRLRVSRGPAVHAPSPGERLRRLLRRDLDALAPRQECVDRRRRVGPAADRVPPRGRQHLWADPQHRSRRISGHPPSVPSPVHSAGDRPNQVPVVLGLLRCS